MSMSATRMRRRINVALRGYFIYGVVSKILALLFGDAVGIEADDAASDARR